MGLYMSVCLDALIRMFYVVTSSTSCIGLRAHGLSGIGTKLCPSASAWCYSANKIKFPSTMLRGRFAPSFMVLEGLS